MHAALFGGTAPTRATAGTVTFPPGRQNDQGARRDATRAIASGEALLAPEITRRLIEHYVRAPAPLDEPRLAELSSREAEVLTLIARGLSNGEIAQRLYVSVGTIKTHVTHILSKLDLRDRVQAVVMAHETAMVKRASHPAATTTPS